MFRLCLSFIVYSLVTAFTLWYELYEIRDGLAESQHRANNKLIELYIENDELKSKVENLEKDIEQIQQEMIEQEDKLNDLEDRVSDIALFITR